jgi:hypothetical protein
MKNKTWNKRALVSAFMLVSFVCLPFTGFMLHAASNMGNGSSKHMWMSVHNVLGIIFCISCMWHLVFNFRGLKKFVQAGTESFLRELIIATCLIAIFVSLAASHAFLL